MEVLVAVVRKPAYTPSPMIREVADLATRAEGLLAICLLLILRGDRLAYPVKRALVNAVAAMMDAHDIAPFQK